VSALILDAGLWSRPAAAADREWPGCVAPSGMAWTCAATPWSLPNSAVTAMAGLAHLLRAVKVRAIRAWDGRRAGVMPGMTGTSEPADATVVLLATPGGWILTSDPHGLAALAQAAACRAVIVAC
jgi:hypothetical protein